MLIYSTKNNFSNSNLFFFLKAVGWNIEPYENVKNWMARCALTIPDYANSNQEGAEQFGKAVRSKLAAGQI